MIQNTLGILNMLNYLVLSAILLILGVFGVFLTRRHLILILISIELILLSVNLNFVVFSVYLDDIVGQVFSLFILMVAAFFFIYFDGCCRWVFNRTCYISCLLSVIWYYFSWFYKSFKILKKIKFKEGVICLEFE